MGFLEKVTEIVGVEVSLETKLNDFDSITRIELLVMLEEEYGITDEQFLAANTLEDLHNML